MHRASALAQPNSTLPNPERVGPAHIAAASTPVFRGTLVPFTSTSLASPVAVRRSLTVTGAASQSTGRKTTLACPQSSYLTPAMCLCAYLLVLSLGETSTSRWGNSIAVPQLGN